MVSRININQLPLFLVYIPEQFFTLSMENPEPPEGRTSRSREKVKEAAEEAQAAAEEQAAADEKQQLIDKYRGLLMVGGKGEEDLNLTPGVVQDKNRRELDEISVKLDAGLLQLSPCSADVEEDSSEEGQAVVKEEVDEAGEESEELGNLLTGQGDARVEMETDLLKEMEIKTEEQWSMSEVSTGELKCSFSSV